MLKGFKFLTILFLTTNLITYTAEKTSASKMSDTRKLNSLIEAYMSGKLLATDSLDSEPCVVYADYDDSSISYTESLKIAHETLKEAYSTARYVISGAQPFPFQMDLFNKDKAQALEYLSNLSEVAKGHIQMLRLYDFLTNRNPGFSLEQENRIRELHSEANKDLSEKQKEERENEIFGQDSDVKLKIVEENRKALALAMKEGDVEVINTACGKPLNLAEFVTLNKSIEQMISDTQQDNKNKNRYINNYSRADAACVIM